MTATTAGIQIRALTVQVADRPLLENAAADFPAGAVTLLVGASGSGKTVLLKILAGLLGGPGDEDTRRLFKISGSIRIAGAEILGSAQTPAAARPPTGIVFQNFALFDELSAADNIRFAADHRPAGGTAVSPQALLDEFSIPARTPVSALSGGQKQRLAIARTLAFDAPVIIYDEPTSGLDPANAARVAERIRTTCKGHGRTTVVVTHDYENLAGIADVVYLLDPETRSLERLEAADLAGVAARLARTPAPASPPAAAPGLARRLAAGAAQRLEATGAMIEKGVASLVYLVPLWRSVRWGARYVRHYLGLIASPSSCLYFSAAGLIAGFVSTHFVFKFLPHKNYTEPLIADDLLEGLGFALYRILTPVLVTILLAARCGAAVASDIGNRVYSHGIDALRSLGVRPPRYLLTGILYAFLLGTPLVVALGFLAARSTSLAVYVYNYPAQGPHYWDGHFHRDLRIPGEIFYRGTLWLAAKTLLCGLGVGAIAYHVGIRPKASGVDVSRGITGTIIGATLYVLVVHFIFAFLEF